MSSARRRRPIARPRRRPQDEFADASLHVALLTPDLETVPEAAKLRLIRAADRFVATLRGDGPSHPTSDRHG